MSPAQEAAARFYAAYKDEFALLEMFWDRIGPDCSKCNSTILTYATNMRSRYCHNFHREHATKDTFFEGSKAIMTLGLSLWLYSQNILVSGAELARIAGVHSSTAWFNLKKVAFMAVDLMDEMIMSPSELFERIIGRRSIETPRRQHPRAEIRVIRRSERNNQNTTERCDSGHRTQTKSNESAVTTEVEGLNNHLAVAVPGKATTLTIFTDQNSTVLERTLRVLESVHQRISRKYLQLFSASMVFLTKKHSFEDLFVRCLRMKPVTIHRVMAYVSPATIHVPAD